MILFRTFTILMITLFVWCRSTQNDHPSLREKIIYQPADKKIAEEVLELFSSNRNLPASELMVKVGGFFKGTPYVAHTLDVSDTERLVINLRGMDCTTFVEYCLAFTKTIRSGTLTFGKFTDELQSIRYRDGIIHGYPSRLHYFSDWIYNNGAKKIVRDVSEETGGTRYFKTISFMSTHPESYRQLADSSGLVKTIVEQEKNISSRTMFYIPEDKITAIENHLKDGDIVGITTNVAGLDISHTGILVRKKGRIYLLHASTTAGKVVVSDKTLVDYLKGNKSTTGIMVARPL